MRIVVKIATVMLQIIYNILCLQRTKNRIVFISRQGDTVPEDFRLLINEIQENHQGIECISLAKSTPKTILRKVGYGLHILKQMQYIATSRVVVVERYCLTVSILKHKKELTVIQTWHALGALKKIGYSILDEDEGMSSAMAELIKMHKNYDYAMVSSEICRKSYAEAFQMDVEKVLAIPLPRLDSLKKEESQNEDGRINVLYAPTFRKNGENMAQRAKELVEQFPEDKYVVKVRLHPLSMADNSLSKDVVDSDGDLYDLINKANIVITDYSSIIFEAAYLEKKIYLYPFDYVSYKHERDFYLDYEVDLPFPKAYSVEELSRVVSDDIQNKEEIQMFVDKYIASTSLTYAKSMADFMVNLILDNEG